MSTPRTLTVLGSTGSIGCSTLDVVRRHPARFRIAALCAHRQVEALARQCLEFRPRLAVVGTAEGAAALAAQLRAAGLATRVAHGSEALCEAAALEEVDTVMAAIVGAAGLMPTLAAVEADKRVLLANKEALVMAGPIFVDAVRRRGTTLLPIDSEHNAVFQALPPNYAGAPASAGVRRILLTASGGPFRQMRREDLATVTPEAACAHPNWVMGRKISVDSATMMNKGLEVIEAHYLFDAPAERIEVVIHPQSVIHSLVDYVDGSVLAQLGNPDMRTPIAHALAYPERVDSGVAPLDLFAVARLDFTAPDLERFPCLRLAYEALRAGGSAPAVLNAANEVAVEAFLDRRLRFIDIAATVEETLGRIPVRAVTTLDEVLTVDGEARRLAAAATRKLAA
jgi:1-deoxy-D-xylulose-5-phosphate reductoisomerase